MGIATAKNLLKGDSHSVMSACCVLISPTFQNPHHLSKATTENFQAHLGLTVESLALTALLTQELAPPLYSSLHWR